MKQRSLRLVETDNRFAGLEPEELNESEAESVMNLALQVLAARHKGSPSRARRTCVSPIA
ncbi:MAG: hypothetical protein WBO43_14055 [Gemmatimonadota bacterium]